MGDYISKYTGGQIDLSVASGSSTSGNISSSLTGTGSFGRLSVVGDTNLTGDITVGGNLTLGNADTDSVKITADLSSSLIPDADNTYDLGTIAKSWNRLVVNDITASGQISASGQIIANRYDIQGYKFASLKPGHTDIFHIGNSGAASLNLTQITASGNISSSGTFTSAGITSTGSAGHLIAYGNISGSGNLVVDGQITASGGILTTNLTASRAYFTNQVTASGGIETTNITASGNLDVYGTDILLSSATSPKLRINDTSTNYGIEIEHINQTARIRFDDAAAQDLEFDSNATAYHMVLDGGTGFVGIGKTLPGEKLEVLGNISASGTFTSAGITSTGSTGHLIAYGDISGSGNLVVDGQITASGGILTTNLTASRAYFTNQITASGGIETTSITASSIQDTSLTVTRLVTVGTGGVLTDSANFTVSGNDMTLGRDLTIGRNLIVDGAISASSHITASGNISSSGTIIGAGITSTGSAGHLIAYGNISGSGNLVVDGQITASGGILTTNLTASRAYFTNQVTASGGIETTSITASSINVGAGAITTTGTTTVGNLVATKATITHLTSSIVSASVIYSSGSNIFGDDTDDGDTHTFNGHITASGNISASGTGIFNKLEIHGADGTLQADYIIHKDDDNTKFGFPSNDHFKIRTAGTDRYVVDTTHTFTGNITTDSHIIASGDISASGTFTSAGITSTGSAGHLIAYGNISGSGNLVVDGQITASSGILTTNLTASRAYFTNQITASGGIETTNITASGNIFAVGNITGSFTSTGSFARVENVDKLVLSTQTIAAAGSGQGDATAIDSNGGSTVFVTDADSAKGVLLPVVANSTIGQQFTIHNTIHNQTLEIYPGSGDKIKPAADNAAITIAASGVLVLIHYSADGWVGYEPAVISA